MKRKSMYLIFIVVLLAVLLRPTWMQRLNLWLVVQATDQARLVAHRVSYRGKLSDLSDLGV